MSRTLLWGAVLAVTSTSLNDLLSTLVARCAECAEACASCAEACASSGMTDTVRACELACTDCADICRTTAQVASRYTGGDTKSLLALVRACARACAEVAAECSHHQFEAAQRCMQASLACRLASEQLGSTLRWR